MSSSRPYRFPRWLSSVRTTMVVLISLSTIFPLGIILYQGLQHRAQAYRDSRILSERIVVEVAFDQQLLLSSAKQLISTFSYNPTIRRRDAVATNALLANFLQENPKITNLLIVDEKGNAWASGLPMKAPINAADRRYFRNVMSTGRFSSGDFTIGRVRNKPTILFGYPLKDGSGRVTDVAVVSLSTDQYERLFQSKGLATDASLALFDYKGTVLYGRPSHDMTGQQDREDLFRKMTAGPDEGSFEAVGLTGVRRVFSYRKLQLPGEPQPYMYVRAGISVSSILDRTQKDFLFGMGSIAAVAILILLASVLLSKRFVLDKVAALREATERISRGNLSTRVPEIVSGGELGELGNAFDNMARRLQDADVERREAEEAIRQSGKMLRESEERFRSIVDIASDGILIAKISTRKFVEANRAICEMLGYTREELIGLGVEDIHPAPDLPHVIVEFNRQSQADKRVAEGLPVKRKDGSVLYADVSANPVEFEGEQYQIGIFRDITERKRAEEALKLSEQRFRVLSEQSPLGMALIDRQGRYEYVNPAFVSIFGYTLKEVPTGADWFRVAFPDPEIRKEVIRAWKEDLAGSEVGKGRPRTFDVACKDGARKSILFRSVSLSLDRQFVIYEDVTRQRELQAQLQQAMKMEAVGRLAGGVAHDFNNLLTVIIGNVALALMKLSPSDPAKALLAEATKAAERATLLTQQLLAFSRKQIIEPKVLDLNVLIADVGKMLARLIGEDIKLQTVHGEELGLVKVDPGQFEQVLVNLAVNARDAMPEGGTLLIETANVELDKEYCAKRPYQIRPGRFVKLAVSDTGHGMTEETSKQIFEPFFTTKAKGKGTGLGLSMIYGAVKQAGGYIEVYSEVGIGATFKIYLPRLEGDAVKPVKDDRPTVIPGGTETVLLVEDENIVRDLCGRILGDLGYKVMPARNGAEAIAMAQKYGDRIDLLLTDVVMPGMNGSELATQLVLHYPGMKVLFTSGYTDDAIVRHGVLDEGVSFIGKPYTPSALARKVREVLGKA